MKMSKNKYLLVGHQKRTEDAAITPKGRKPMGRKGIGKLSMFSIADKISVYTKKRGSLGEAFELDAKEIKKHIENNNRIKKRNEENPYIAPSLEFNNDTEGGTIIKIAEFKRSFTKNTYNGLKKRIARRFSIIGDEHNFNVLLNGDRITYADRGYFSKARFLFEYGGNFPRFYEKLDKDDNGTPLSFSRNCQFNDAGEADNNGKYAVRGWIAIARHSNDLDGDSKDDNLNKVTLVVRGKVAQEDLLYEHRLGGMITKYMYGEIEADFLDDDKEMDIATSSRQKIIESDQRYKDLMKFIGKEFKYIWKETNKLKDKRGMEEAIRISPPLKEWYENLKHENLKKRAQKIFGAIDKSSGEDGVFKRELFSYGVLAFEKERMKHSLDLLDKINEDNVQQLLAFFQDVDDIEAAYYHEIVRERLTVIKQLEGKSLDKVNIGKRIAGLSF